MWGPQEYLTYGVLGGMIGGFMLAIALDDGSGTWAFIGWVLALAAGALFSIGVVAQGVTVGMREHRRERQGGQL